MAETLARSLIKLIVTVAILAAVYFFLIRPILDTTNDTINKAFDGFDGVESSIDNAFDDAGIDAPSISNLSGPDADRLLACIKRVQPNTSRMNQCVDRFGG